ncbi:hypothetical protein DIE18_03285 [Burkholderia sp. Bp9125]|nr:hypothetical protein DIE18_03285 [Burkholderia sp. Bp9125]
MLKKSNVSVAITLGVVALFALYAVVCWLLAFRYGVRFGRLDANASYVAILLTGNVTLAVLGSAFLPLVLFLPSLV